MTAPTDSFAAIVAELRTYADPGPKDLPRLAIVHELADRIERLDAEMRKELKHAQTCFKARTKANTKLANGNADIRARMAACEKGFEVRCNEDGTLDEVVGSGTVHLEQMSGDHWWLGFGIGPMLHVNLHARSKIKATVMDERATRASVPKDAATGDEGKSP